MTRRYVLFAVGALLLAAAALAGWSARHLWDDRRCAYLSAHPPVFEGYIHRFPDYQHPVSPAVLASIYTCWSLNGDEEADVYGYTPVLRLKHAKQVTPTTYLLAFEMWGVSDRSYVFLVDNDGTVTKAYGYPYSI